MQSAQLPERNAVLRWELGDITRGLYPPIATWRPNRLFPCERT